MKPSQEALDLNESLKLLRACRGSWVEGLAQLAHEKLVERIRVAKEQRR